jgi:hypothetical protein
MTNAASKRAAWGRIGGVTAWSRNGIDTMLVPARRGFVAKFEKQVDPEGVLAPEERRRRADCARRAWMLQLAARSAQVRHNGKTAPAGSSAGAVKEAADAPGEPQRSG